MPSEVATGFEYREPNWFTKAIAGRESGFLRDPKGRTFNPSNLTYQSLFQEPRLAFRPNPDPVLAGVHRPDARSFVDLVAKHERDVIEKAFSADQLQRVALKDENGEPVVAMTQTEVSQKYGNNWVLTHPTYPIHWYQQEQTVADMVSKMEAVGFKLDGPELQARLANEAEDAAVDATFAARRMPGWVIPRDFAEYQRKLETTARPYENKFFRGYARAMNTWRTWTLSMMPRWALNTAVGSSVLTTIKGVHPGQYRIAGKLGEKGVFDMPETSGVDLGSVIGMEMLESGAQGYLDSAFGIKVGPGSRWAMQKVQKIEDHFRRASFVQSLDRQHKQMMYEQGNIIENLETAKGPRSTEEYIDFIKDNPEAVKKALADVDRFAYNFAALGPFERRYIRQAVPFWGWYKFISGLAYRLPVDFPGRTNLMSHLGTLGTNQTQEGYGDLPAWLKGALPLSGDNSNFKYLSTMGLNPFSQIFNPTGPEGAVSGSLQLSQGSPLFQAIMAGAGIDTLRGGGTVPIHPSSGIAPDPFGQYRDVNTGEEVNVGQRESGARVVAALLRAFPQVRIGERVRSGGRSVYPESIPLVRERFMPTKPEARFGGSIADALEQIVGFAPRPYDLEGYQSRRKKFTKYARTRQKSSLKKHKKALEK
jgi:hypothetical protein